MLFNDLLNVCGSRRGGCCICVNFQEITSNTVGEQQLLNLQTHTLTSSSGLLANELHRPVSHVLNRCRV